MPSKIDEARPFIPVGIAILTVSDTRTLNDDKSGNVLVERLQSAGHRLVDRDIVRDDFETIVDRLRTWISDAGVNVVIATGGTGVTGRDVTPEAFQSVFEKEVAGFGELFRMLSYEKIGTSTIQSRATAGGRRRHLSFRGPRLSGSLQRRMGRYSRLPTRLSTQAM